MSTSAIVPQRSKPILSIGLIWRDDNPKRNTALKIERAAKQFIKLHGFAPNLVYCNPDDCDGTTHPTITIKHARSVRLNNFYLCIGGAA